MSLLKYKLADERVLKCLRVSSSVNLQESNFEKQRVQDKYRERQVRQLSRTNGQTDGRRRGGMSAQCRVLLARYSATLG